MQAFIDKSLDDVVPKFRQCAEDFLLNFLHFAKDLAQNIKNCAKENGTVQKIMYSS